MPALRVTAGTLRGRRVPVPPHEVRPTSERARQAYFNIVGGRIAGARFLDLFAGSGIFSFEAVSRGAAPATAVERDKKYAAAIERLAKEWEAPVTVLARDVFTALPRLEGTFDLVYADPPYDFGRYDELIAAIGKIGLSDDALVAIEHRRLAVGRGPLADADGSSANGQRPTANELRAVRHVEYGEVALTFFAR
ncbi:MAG: RsmD family RNA methyltransferase [Acidobacteriota bacterium]